MDSSSVLLTVDVVVVQVDKDEDDSGDDAVNEVRGEHVFMYSRPRVSQFRSQSDMRYLLMIGKV